MSDVHKSPRSHQYQQRSLGTGLVAILAELGAVRSKLASGRLDIAFPVDDRFDLVVRPPGYWMPNTSVSDRRQRPRSQPGRNRPRTTSHFDASIIS